MSYSRKTLAVRRSRPSRDLLRTRSPCSTEAHRQQAEFCGAAARLAASIAGSLVQSRAWRL